MVKSHNFGCIIQKGSTLLRPWASTLLRVPYFTVLYFIEQQPIEQQPIMNTDQFPFLHKRSMLMQLDGRKLSRYPWKVPQYGKHDKHVCYCIIHKSAIPLCSFGIVTGLLSVLIYFCEFGQKSVQRIEKK